MVKKYPILLLFWALPVALFSLPLDDLVRGDLKAELLEGGIITRVQHKDPAADLIPLHDFTRELIRGALEDVDASLMVESLFLYRKPPRPAADAADARGAAWTQTERAALYNRALALSSLAGLQYFSTSRNRMRTFYETSAVIDGPDTKRVLPDPEYQVPPPELTLYARQKDLTFGDNIYRYNYYAQADALFFVQENVTIMNAGIIPAVGRNNLRSAVAVIDAGDYLLIYAASMAKAASLPGMNNRVGASFSTRAEAILKWFAGQADKALGR
jgi:hypothetical protein